MNKEIEELKEKKLEKKKVFLEKKSSYIKENHYIEAIIELGEFYINKEEFEEAEKTLSECLRLFNCYHAVEGALLFSSRVFFVNYYFVCEKLGLEDKIKKLQFFINVMFGLEYNYIDYTRNRDGNDYTNESIKSCEADLYERKFNKSGTDIEKRQKEIYVDTFLTER